MSGSHAPRPFTRRKFLKTAAGAAAGAAAAPLVPPMINRGRFQLFADSTQEYSARTVRLVRESRVIDMLALFGHDESEWLEDPTTFTEEDFERYRTSGIDVFHIARTAGSPTPYEGVLTYIARWNGFVSHHPDWFMRISRTEDLDRIHGSGKVGILIGIQDSSHFRTVDDVESFHGLGQRVSQLTYNSQNRIGSGCMDRVDGGISDFGVDVVKEMNRVGMAVDVAHSGDRTTLDAMEVSEKPVLITHANARALVPGYPRNKTDEAIRKMAGTGGVMGLTGLRSFVRDREPTTLEHLLDHYDHVAELVGVEHVGIGTDMTFAGYDAHPPDVWENIGGRYREQYAFRDRIDIDELRHPKRTFDLVEGLTERGYSDDHIRLILGGNFRRVLGEIWGDG